MAGDSMSRLANAHRFRWRAGLRHEQLFARRCLSANAEIPDSASATVEESNALRVFGPPPALMAPHWLRRQVPVWSCWDFAQLDKGDIAAAENWEQRLDALIRQADTVFLFRTCALAGR